MSVFQLLFLSFFHSILDTMIMSLLCGEVEGTTNTSISLLSLEGKGNVSNLAREENEEDQTRGGGQPRQEIDKHGIIGRAWRTGSGTERHTKE
jgi:hypothetical protein